MEGDGGLGTVMLFTFGSGNFLPLPLSYPTKFEPLVELFSIPNSMLLLILFSKIEITMLLLVNL